MDLLSVAVVVIPGLAAGAYYVHKIISGERASRSVRDAAIEQGLIEPPSLHPVIDDLRCIGCGGCVAACPEQNVLGLIGGKAALIGPTHCIGHGACRTACPTDAIALVFGTERRGVDIPLISPDFETNVPGLFIAGELGGMGLIRNAIEQGRQAVDSIRKLEGIGSGDRLDLVIVGAGPAGISASLAAKEHRLRSVTIEQDSLGGTVAHYPRGKIVMTAPAELPIIGKVQIKETTKEKLLEFWQEVERVAGLEIRYRERLEDVTSGADGFVVKTSERSYRARAVLLTIGRRGTPRKLGVPGEALDKVVYRLIDPEQFAHRRVLVVGGGDSAIEAATSLAEQPGTEVTISYRSGSFSRAKERNRARALEQEQEGRLRILLGSTVESIEPDRVVIERAGSRLDLPNDQVIICAGGILPTPFLEKLGVEVRTKFGVT